MLREAVHKRHDGAAALDQPPPGVHVGGLGKSVEAALGEKLNGQRHVPGLRFRLTELV